MRRRRRHRDYYSRDRYTKYETDSILLAEFLFYNRQKQLIDEKILTDIRDKLLSTEKIETYWTNKEFADAGVGFKIFKTPISNGEKTKYEVNITIMEFDFIFTPEQFKQCDTIIQRKLFITFPLSSGQRIVLNNISINDMYFNDEDDEDDDDKQNHEPYNVELLNTWEDIINYLIQSKSLSNYEEQDDYEFDKFMADMLLLLSTTIEKKEYKIYYEKHNRPEKLRHIIEVIEKRINDTNYRIAITCRFRGYSNTIYGLKIIKEDDEIYNYIDKNRLWLSFNNNKNYFLDLTLNEYDNGQPIINLDLFGLMSDNIQEVLGDNKVINPQIYRFYADRVMRFQYDNGTLSEKDKAILKQYQKLVDNNRMIKVGNTYITKTKIAVEGETFTMKFDIKFLDVIENLHHIKKILNESDSRYNFNTLYENLLKLSVLKIIDRHEVKEKEYKDFTSASFSVNGMKVTVSKTNSRIKINGIFCRIDDIIYILSKLICYNNIDEFNQYVKEVSHIGVEWKKMISNGIALEIKNPFFKLFEKVNKQHAQTLYLRFSLLWDSEDRRKIYLLLNDNKYLIRYKGKFKQLFNKPRQELSISTLKRMLDTCINGLDDEMIINIVSNAIKEAKIIQERGLMLVKDTIEEINAIETKIDIKGQEIHGYKITGRVTQAEYFVGKSDLAVYKFVNGTWNRRCVIDDHRKQRIFEDRLANRLVNIYNEPKKIFTLHNL